jgi:hypothetical protein
MSFPFDDNWWLNNTNPYYRNYHKKPSSFLDDMMKVIESLMDNQDVINRLNVKKSATVNVEKDGKQYKVFIEEITPDEVEPPVRIEIQDDDGNPIKDSDKHPDYTE